jgi:hypothetical protein
VAGGTVAERMTVSVPEHTAAATHRDTLRAADIAFRRMRFDIPPEASALRDLSLAWTEYLYAYEALALDSGGAVESDLVERLRMDVLRLAEYRGEAAQSAVDRSVAAVPDPATASPDGDRPAKRHPETGVWSGHRAPHNLPWLSPTPATNVEPIELWIWTTIPPEQAPGHGLPTADLFVLAHLDPERLAAERRSGFLLRIFVPSGAAVDLSTYPGQLPDRLRQRRHDRAGTYLLPVAWLAGVTTVAGYELDGQGHCVAVTTMRGVPLTVNFTGGAHGVPGLPNSVVPWPLRRSHRTAYVTAPDDPRSVAARLRAYPGWLPANRHRPRVPPGYHVLCVEVRHRCAIDIPATLENLASVLSSASGLGLFTGIDLALPAWAFPTTTVTDTYPEQLGVSYVGRPLAAVLGAGS